MISRRPHLERRRCRRSGGAVRGAGGRSATRFGKPALTSILSARARPPPVRLRRGFSLRERDANERQQAQRVHRRRGRHDRARHPRPPRRAAAGRAEEPARRRSARTRRRAATSWPRSISSCCACRTTRRASRRRSPTNSATTRRNCSTPAPRTGSIRTGPTAFRKWRQDQAERIAAAAQGRQSRLLSDRRDRPAAAAGRGRADPARLPDLDQRGQRLFRRRQVDDRGA